MLRIGVDATCWLNNRGYGRHARALLRSLVKLDPGCCYTFVVDSSESLGDYPIEVDVRLVKSSTPTALAAAADGRRSLSDMWRMSRALSSPDFDVLLFPTLYTFVPVFSRAKKAVIIHDVIPEKFPELTFPKRLPRLFWQLKSAMGRRQADAIITVSEFSRRLIMEHFKLPPRRVFVVGEASDPVFRVLPEARITTQGTPRLAAFQIPPEGRLVVYVGGFGPHKNLESLVAAFGNLAMQTEFSDVRLVLVGEYRKEVFYSAITQVQEQIGAHGLTDRIIFTGYLPDDELVVLLNLATVLALPSWMEGFGLPAVEAAACGCPVVATTASPLPELLGAGGIYIDPGQPKELENALRRVLFSPDLQREMGEAGLAAASTLTWEAAALQMKDLLHRLAIS